MTTIGATNLESMEVTVPAAVTAEYRATCAADPPAISAAVGAAFQRIQGFLETNSIAKAGAPRVIYTEWGPSGVKFTAAVPIGAVPPNVRNGENIAIEPVAESRALRFIHRGAYRDIRHTYDRIEAWLRARGGIKTAADWARYSPMWEEYVTDPATTPESELITRIYLTLP